MFHAETEPSSDRKTRLGRPPGLKSRIAAVGLMAAALGISGCQICADCDLESYPTYGGAWQRTTRDTGRVGSIYDSGGARVAELEPRTDPEAADAEMRRRDSGQAIDLPDEEEEGGVERQFRENQEPRSQADEEGELQQQQDRLRDLRLEEIRKQTRPTRQWD